MQKFRVEYDSLGEMRVPAEAYYGVQTVRALENFPITGIPISTFPALIRALGYVKKACALANLEFNILDPTIAEAMIKACDEIIEDKHTQQFPVDVIQGGAGTSVNMNANEVVANRALEILGEKRGEYQKVHPNNHVNLSQSTNDVYPTSIRLAAIWMLNPLIEQLERLHQALATKGEEFSDVIKMGRTQLQDAVPMTLGQEFSGYSVGVAEDIEKVKRIQTLLYSINMGATAIGTQINAPEGYAPIVTDHLAKLTSLPLTVAPNLVQATNDTTLLVEVSATLKGIATRISKVCNDLRLLSSGPRTGIGEITLPAMQPGSSIMPGKVNPVIAEVFNQIAFSVIGNDVAITIASEAGQLELNVMEPLIAFKLFSSISHLTNGLETLTDRCIVGIVANRERSKNLVANSIGIITALVPILGYEKCATIANKALESGDSIYNIVLEEGHLSVGELEKILQPESML